MQFLKANWFKIILAIILAAGIAGYLAGSRYYFADIRARGYVKCDNFTGQCAYIEIE